MIPQIFPGQIWNSLIGDENVDIRLFTLTKMTNSVFCTLALITSNITGRISGYLWQIHLCVFVPIHVGLVHKSRHLFDVCIVYLI